MANSSNVGSVFFSKPISDILTEVSGIRDCTRKLSKLDFYLGSLEGERSKVEAFKRQLPYCMDMLDDAIEMMKKEMAKCREEMGRPLMEEFIPLKAVGDGTDDSYQRAKWSNGMGERRSWMSSVHLWSTPIENEGNLEAGNEDPLLSLESVKRDQGQESNGLNGCSFQNMDGEFLPFKKSEGKRPLDGLSLCFPPVADYHQHPQVEALDLNVQEGSGSGSGDSTRPGPLSRRKLSPKRKQRRCWSPELHRRFVEALQILGGPQTATPKQIRELMKVDGLTNDEVKSHLQKYRLHIRKLPNLMARTVNYSWLMGEQHVVHDPLKRMVGATHSASPQDHLHGGGSARGGSATGGDSMEEDEDDRIDSWKARVQRAMQ